MARKKTFLQISSTPYIFPNYKTTARIEVMLWMSNYISHETMIVISYPCPDIRRSRSVKGAPKLTKLRSNAWIVKFDILTCSIWLDMKYNFRFQMTDKYIISVFQIETVLSWINYKYILKDNT